MRRKALSVTISLTVFSKISLVATSLSTFSSPKFLAKTSSQYFLKWSSSLLNFAAVFALCFPAKTRESFGFDPDVLGAAGLYLGIYFTNRWR